MYKLVERIKENSGSLLPSYRLLYRKIGVTPFEQRFNQINSEAETVEVALYDQAGEPTQPVVSGSNTFDLVEKIVEGANLLLKTYRWIFARRGTTNWTTLINEYGADVQELEVSYFNRTSKPTVSLADYIAISTQVNNPDAVQSDYIYRYRKIGTVKHQERVYDKGSAEELIVLVLLSRPTAPETSPKITGYTIVETEIRRTGTAAPDYAYVFLKDGTENYDIRTLHSGTDHEIIERLYLNWKSAPSPTPSIDGYVLRESQIQNPGKIHKNYIYIFTKIGTENYSVTISQAGTDVERKSVTFFSRETRPDPTLANYALLGEEVSRPGESTSDYTFHYGLIGTKAEETIQLSNSGFEKEDRVVILYSRDEEPDAPDISGLENVSMRSRGEGVLKDYIYAYKAFRDHTATTGIINQIDSIDWMKRITTVFIGVKQASVASLISTLQTPSTGCKVVSIQNLNPGEAISDIVRIEIVIPTTVLTWTNSLRKQWFKSGGVLIQRVLQEAHTVGWVATSAAATAASLFVAAHSDGLVSVLPSPSGYGMWEYHRVETYWA